MDPLPQSDRNRSWQFFTVHTSDGLLIDGQGGGRSLAEFNWFTGVNSQRDRVVLIGSEMPVRLTDAMGGRRAEFTHVERFNTVHQRLTGRPAFVRFRRGDDPPDFVVQRRLGGPLEALECTALTGENRRKEYRRFRSVEEALVEQPNPKETFRHLRGRLVMLDFPEELPPWSSADPVVAEIVEALKTLQPDPAHDAVTEVPPDRSGWPFPLPSGVKVDMPRLQRGHRPSEAVDALGFDLAMMRWREWRVREVTDEFERLVLRKDRSENEWLLVSAGAPMGDGLALPGDDLMGKLAIHEMAGLRGLQHLKRVTVHCCLSDEAWDLFPEKRLVFRADSTPWFKLDIGRNEQCPCGSGQKYKRCHQPM